jgi:hypothetical protein
MPLVNSPTLTPSKLAANRAKAQPSRGPITLEGLSRVCDAHIKHGAYAQHMGAGTLATGPLGSTGMREGGSVILVLGSTSGGPPP